MDKIIILLTVSNLLMAVINEIIFQMMKKEIKSKEEMITFWKNRYEMILLLIGKDEI